MNQVSLCRESSADSAAPATAARPLKVMFVLTFMPVGGAETLLVNLVRRMDRRRFAPEICCLKQLGPLGEELAQELPAFSRQIGSKYDVSVWPRLARLFRRRRVDAVITVGTGGDKMFWGRLAAWTARVPVVASALHSTGHPDRVERLNRCLAPWTDAFIAVAPAHGRYIADHEGCPADKVWVIPNGVDVARFSPRAADPDLRARLGLPQEAPVVSIVAALRPEKNHELFLEMAARLSAQRPETHFLVIGDGPRRAELNAIANRMGLSERVHFLGSRSDVPELLALTDVVALTSRMEANPVSLLEALACERPVVAPAVGSIPDSVPDGVCGLLAAPGDTAALAARTTELLADAGLRRRLGQAGRRRVVNHFSLDEMVAGYECLIRTIYESKRGPLPPLPDEVGLAAAPSLESGDLPGELPTELAVG